MMCVKCSEPRYSNSSYCKKHHSELVNAYRARNRDKINEKNKKYMADRRRGNACEICGSTVRIKRDTALNGEHRGFLCSSCREVVEYVEKNTDLVVNAQHYIFDKNFAQAIDEFQSIPDDVKEPMDLRSRRFLWGK